jgi:hypothetical protein
MQITLRLQFQLSQGNQKAKNGFDFKLCELFSNYICPHAIVFITLYVAQAALDKKETLLATQFILMRL